MDSKSKFKTAVRDCFLGGDDLNLLFNGFEGSNEKKWVGNRRQRFLMGHGETLFDVDGLVEIQ